VKRVLVPHRFPRYPCGRLRFTGLEVTRGLPFLGLFRTTFPSLFTELDDPFPLVVHHCGLPGEGLVPFHTRYSLPENVGSTFPGGRLAGVLVVLSRNRYLPSPCLIPPANVSYRRRFVYDKVNSLTGHLEATLVPFSSLRFGCSSQESPCWFSTSMP